MPVLSTITIAIRCPTCEQDTPVQHVFSTEIKDNIKHCSFCGEFFSYTVRMLTTIKTYKVKLTIEKGGDYSVARQS